MTVCWAGYAQSQVALEVKQGDAKKLLAVCVLSDNVFPTISPARLNAISSIGSDEDTPDNVSGLDEVDVPLPHFESDVRKASALHAQSATVSITTSVIVPDHVGPSAVCACRIRYVQHTRFMKQVCWQVRRQLETDSLW
jgi:hypothetical protein